jgi:hypothetical protein
MLVMNPKWLASWMVAAVTSASSPLPPEKAPVRRSEMNGHMPKLMRLPRRTRFMTHRQESVSAKLCTSVPASAAGDVAPACGAIATSPGRPSSASFTSTSALSLPKRSGETIGQPPNVQKGLSRKAPSRPR